MRIANPFNASAPTPLTAVRAPVAPAPTAGPARADEAVKVTISPAAWKLSSSTAVDPARAQELKLRVSSGTYAVNHLSVARAMLAEA